MARSFPTLREWRLLLPILAVSAGFILVAAWPAQATKPDLVPTIHIGDERFPRLADTGDTLCVYGGVGSEEGNFQIPATNIPDWQGWIGVDRTGLVGDYAQVFPRVTDLDPSFEDFSPVAGFIDNALPPGGSSNSPVWTYGIPGGFVVNYTDSSGVWNEIWSPEIEWDLPGIADDDLKGCLLEFLVWRHLPVRNGIFYTWAVRSTANNGATWTDFRSYNEAYFGTGRGDWLRHRTDVGPLLVANPTHVQIALGVVDLSHELGLPGNDATPSPVFDRVSLCKYRTAGPIIILRDEDRFQDAFAQSGGTDVGTSQDRDLLDVRIDVGRDIDPGPVNTPGDSMIVKVRALGQFGISSPSTQILMHWILDVNPLFEPALRGANPGVVIPGGAPNGWDQYTGTVGASQVTVSGSPIPDLYFFDLPDADFMYPGDELRYYIAATDDGANTTTEPTDTTDFSTGGDVFSEESRMEANPGVSDATGTQPPILFVEDGLNLERVYDIAFKNLGLVEGEHYDWFTVNSPESCIGNGIGSPSGPSLDQMDQYTLVIYDCGDLEDCLLSDGSGTDGNDDGDDISLITAWHGLAGDRFIFYFGDNLASASPTDFVQYVMGIDAVGADVSADIGGQSTPLVQPQSPAWTQQYTVYGGVPALNTFDEISPETGATTSHVFTSRSGTPLGVAASVIWDRLDISTDRKVDITFPYSFASIYEESADYVPTAARTELLRELLTQYGIVDTFGSPTAVDTSPAASLHVAVYPNPSNPRAVVRLSLGRSSPVSAVIYDLRGRRVRALVEDRLPAGIHDVPWNGQDDSGTAVASGVYVLRVSSEAGNLVRKIALLR